MPEQDPLAQLRDIHLPETISSWPPAIGWWIVLILAISLLAGAIYLWRSARHQNRYRRLALKQLTSLDQYTANPGEFLQALNQLLKQTALAANPPAPVASLSGRQWMEFLDNSGNCDQFTQGCGAVLMDGPYAPPSSSALNTEELQKLAAQWIKKHRFDRSNT